MKIIPSILTGDPKEALEMLREAEVASDVVQVDIVDGVFAENKTIDPLVFAGVETPAKLDFHLMVKEPINWVEKCVRGGADRIIGQVEMMTDQKAFMEKVQSVGCRVGLAIDLATSVEVLDKLILTDLDVVLVMSVEAGWGGQDFSQQILSKLKELAVVKKADASPFSIVVDGGITVQNVSSVSELGGDEVVVGRRLYEGSMAQNIQNFLKAAGSEN